MNTYEKAFIRRITKQGLNIIRLNSKVGVPDFLVVYKGNIPPIFYEVKGTERNIKIHKGLFSAEQLDFLNDYYRFSKIAFYRKREVFYYTYRHLQGFEESFLV